MVYVFDRFIKGMTRSFRPRILNSIIMKSNLNFIVCRELFELKPIAFVWIRSHSSKSNLFFVNKSLKI